MICSVLSADEHHSWRLLRRADALHSRSEWNLVDVVDAERAAARKNRHQEDVESNLPRSVAWVVCLHLITQTHKLYFFSSLFFIFFFSLSSFLFPSHLFLFFMFFSLLPLLVLLLLSPPSSSSSSSPSYSPPSQFTNLGWLKCYQLFSAVVFTLSFVFLLLVCTSTNKTNEYTHERQKTRWRAVKKPWQRLYLDKTTLNIKPWT